MANVEESVWLNARPEDVWPFLVEPDKLVLWLTEMHRYEWLDQGPIGVGTRYAVEKEIRGQVRRYDSVVREWEENRRFVFTSEAPGFSTVQGEWEIVPEGQGCRFTMSEQINVQNANPLVDRLFVQRSASRAMRGFLANLKRLVESEV